METLLTVNVVIFAIVAGIVLVIGFDLRKWYSWLLGVYGFLTFFLLEMITGGNINEAIKEGALFAFLTMLGGAAMRWNRELVKKWRRKHDKEQEFLDALSKIKPEPKKPPK